MINVRTLFLTFALLTCLPPNSSGQRVNWSSPGDISQVATKERIKELLVRPPCLESSSETAAPCIREEVTIPSGEIELLGVLYLPKGPGSYPAIIYMHGGGNNYDMLMDGPRYYASRLAGCGYAALIYDKRGTGKSGGVFHESTYDDYISDAGHAAEFLAKHDQIDPGNIGVYGGSQGGRLAPLVAVRFPIISFVISVSGPVGSLADHANFNMRYALEVRGYADSTIEQVMPLWRKHHDAWESMNPDELNEVKEEIMKMRAFIDPIALPNTPEEFLTDSNLFFLRPTYNSMSRDYLSELAGLNVPWLALFGELDPIINVRESVENIKKQMAVSRNDNCEIIVFKNAGHSLENLESGEYVPTASIIINWLEEKIPD